MSMRLTVAVHKKQEEDVVTLDVGPETSIDTLKAILEVDTQIPAQQQQIYYKKRLITDDNATLGEIGWQEGDMIDVVEPRDPARSRERSSRQEQRRQPPHAENERDDAEILRLQALSDPHTMSQLREYRPELADAVQDPRAFREVWTELARGSRHAELEKQRLTERLNSDPFDVEAQKKIEEIIRQEAVEKNLQHALDYTPEAFGRVTMLYIPVEVNGHPIKAFVDSGAQATIMSPGCAEQCNIMRLLDRRFAGMARGVGTAKILGRVHSAQIKIGTNFLPCNFTVMEGKDVDLLLGLDMLKRHRACIDLEKSVLRILGSEVAFLGEADIPKENYAEEPSVQGPGGLAVGGRTGAVIAPSGGGEARQQQVPHGGSAASAPTQAQSQPQLPPRPAQPTQSGEGQYPSEHVQQLMALGVSKEEAEAALQVAGGNVDLAAGMLLG